MDTWAEGRGRTTVDQVVGALLPWLAQADGITVSGGEPFDQPAALDALLEAIPLSPTQDVLVYSGYALEELPEVPALRQGRVDALMTDPFVANATQTLPLRGSDNQRLHLLTPLGRRNFLEFHHPMTDERRRNLDVMFDQDGTVWLAGIPKPGDIERLRDVLDAQGHQIWTTASHDR